MVRSARRAKLWLISPPVRPGSDLSFRAVREHCSTLIPNADHGVKSRFGPTLGTLNCIPPAYQSLVNKQGKPKVGGYIRPASVHGRSESSECSGEQVHARTKLLRPGWSGHSCKAHTSLWTLSLPASGDANLKTSFASFVEMKTPTNVRDYHEVQGYHHPRIEHAVGRADRSLIQGALHLARGSAFDSREGNGVQDVHVPS